MRETVQASLLGALLLSGFLVLFGFTAQNQPEHLLPVWFWRSVGTAGALQFILTLPAFRVRQEWSRWAAMAGVAFAMIPIAVMLIHGLSRRSGNPANLALMCGLLGMGLWVRFYNRDDVKAWFRQGSTST